MFTIFTFLVDNEKVEEEEKSVRWSWFKMFTNRSRREEEEEEEEEDEKKPEAAKEKRNRSNL